MAFGDGMQNNPRFALAKAQLEHEKMNADRELSRINQTGTGAEWDNANEYYKNRLADYKMRLKRFEIDELSKSIGNARTQGTMYASGPPRNYVEPPADAREREAGLYNIPTATSQPAYATPGGLTERAAQYLRDALGITGRERTLENY